MTDTALSASVRHRTRPAAHVPWQPRRLRPSSAASSSPFPISGCCSSSSFPSSSSSRFRCRRRRSPCRPTCRSSTLSEGFSVWSQLARAELRQLHLADRGRALLQRLCLERRHRGDLDLPHAAGRLSHRLRHGARAGHHPPDAADAGHPAVLDLVPDPRLCLDRHPQAGGPAQPVPAGDRHHRRAAASSSTPTRRSSSASSIPTCPS